ncbi:DUF2851 family protein [Chitinophagaceae bacterium MMS25-I14]
MNEMLLQFIWQYSLYQPHNLQTPEGEPLVVIFPGKRNTDAGPDFTEAKIRVGNTILAGNIELHVHTSDWRRHRHQHDPAYRNIILHVVYNNDVPYSHVPLLELGKHIPQYVVNKYTHLIQTTRTIPCGNMLPDVKSIVKESWLNRLLAERWEDKLGEWKELLAQSVGDWRNLLYWRLAANFGFKVNATPFLMLARSLPLNILAKHREHPLDAEALLFGQAGFLTGKFKDEYPRKLQQQYQYLRRKYQLQPIPVHLWKFLRMRPANFPTVRIAQFAALIRTSVHLFSQIISLTAEEDILPLLNAVADSYWDNHVRFDELQKRAVPKRLGTDSARNIIINTIAPIQFLYAYQHGHSQGLGSALQLLEAVPPEENNVTALWAEHGWRAENAAHSQAMIQLFRNYCSGKRCLECSIGLSIVRSGPDK